MKSLEPITGRCCGRKPMVYKKPEPHFFCPRCNRSFNLYTKDQVPNWAWKQDTSGVFSATYPKQDYAKLP